MSQQGQDLDKKQNEILYLSSELNESKEQDGIPQKKKIELSQEQEQQERTFIYYFLILLMIVIFLVPISVVILIYVLINKQSRSIFIVIVILISGSSILFSIILFFFVQIENKSIYLLFQDSIFFFFSVILVATFLVVNTEAQTAYSKLNILKKENFLTLLFTLNYTYNRNADDDSYQLDYNCYLELVKRHQQYSYYSNYSHYQYRDQSELTQNKITQYNYGNCYLNYIHENKFPKSASQYSYFKKGGRSYEIENFYYGFHDYLYPNIKHFLILSGIIVIKIAFVFMFIQKHTITISTRDIINITMVFFVYLYIAFLLNKLLANNDLRRKKIQMKVFNDYINFIDVNKDNYKQKLDITCPISIETWDNARKYILSYKKEFLAQLEISYFCLVFYYLSVSIVCASYYFDLNWLISQESQLFNPIIVIMSSFNFIFLTAFLMFRFQSRTEYNDSFGDIEYSITYLLDVVSDLDTMYNKFFNQQNNEDRYSSYGLIIKRIKLLSKDFIKEKIKYQNKIYQDDEKENLRRKMIEEIKKSLVKIKFSIQTDREQFNYKFINMIEVSIKDFLFTLTIGLVTTLPTIIPKFIKFYE